ncbi:MAG: hypothetical protein IJZ51_01955 [Ruminiclostridium sp.]|nr:hypothetical protein [Ruminiclostridium sp.]
MENNNQNANWQQALDDLNTAADQTNQTVQNVQPEQPVQSQQPVQDNSWFAQQNDQNTYDAGDFAVLPAKQKSNKTLIIVLVIVAAAILIGGGIFLLLSMNKSAGYETLERNYFSGLTAQIDGVADMTKTGADMKFTLVPGTAMTNGADVAPTTLKAKVYSDSVALKAYAEMTYVAGDTDIASIKYWMDDETYYLQIPELSDVIVKLDASTLASLGMGSIGGMEDIMTAPMMDDTVGALPADPSDMLAGYTEALQNLDPEVVEKAFGLIADAYFVTVKDCTKTTTGTLQCGEVSINCDVNTITITMKDFMNLALNVLNKVEADAEIMDVLADFQIDKAAIASAKTYVEESIKELPEEQAKKVLLTMTVYSKGKDIVGRIINIADSGEIRIITANDGKKFATEIALATDGVDKVKFTANGTVEGEKHDGTFVCESVGDENTAKITGSFSLTINDYLNGTINIEGDDSDGTSKQDLALTIATSKDDFKLGMDIVQDGASLMKLDIEGKTIPYEAVTAPTGTIADASNASDANLAKFTQDITNGLTTIMTKLSDLEKPDVIYVFLVGLSAGMGNVA